MGAIAVQGAVGDAGNKATTNLPNFNFNSMVTINGFSFGANDTGLYKLNTGNKDDGMLFTKTFTLATTDFADKLPKHVRYIYVSIYTNNDFEVKFKADSQEEKTLSVAKLKDGLQWIRVENIYPDIGKYWTIAVSSKYYFRVDVIKILYYPISTGNLTYTKVI